MALRYEIYKGRIEATITLMITIKDIKNLNEKIIFLFLNNTSKAANT